MTDDLRERVGRASHEAWKRWIVGCGYADHLWPTEQYGNPGWYWVDRGQGVPLRFFKRCGGCGLLEEKHHPDMIAWEALPDEKRVQYVEMGMAGHKAVDALDLSDLVVRTKNRLDQAEAQRDNLVRAAVRMLNTPYSGEISADPEYGYARDDLRRAIGFDAGDPDRNHHDWFWPSYVPRPLTAEWLAELRADMLRARDDPFCDDAAETTLILLTELEQLRAERAALAAEVERLREAVNTALGVGEPYSLVGAVEVIARCADEELRERDYDRMGWETIAAATSALRANLPALVVLARLAGAAGAEGE